MVLLRFLLFEQQDVIAETANINVLAQSIRNTKKQPAINREINPQMQAWLWRCVLHKSSSLTRATKHRVNSPTTQCHPHGEQVECPQTVERVTSLGWLNERQNYQRI